MSEFESKVREALANPSNQGEMSDADSVGTVGSADCGDMLRMWLKFKEEDGKKVIDRASFQAFGCQTAMAVASLATELLKGKSIEEARQMKAEQLSAELGPIPPMKIHCGQLVEGALQQALGSSNEEAESTAPPAANNTLSSDMQQPSKGKLKIKFKD